MTHPACSNSAIAVVLLSGLAVGVAAVPSSAAAAVSGAAAAPAAVSSPTAPVKAPAAPASPRAAAMIDLTGYWVSVITEDWEYRMLTAPKGDAGSLPVTEAAKKAAANWDPAADAAAGESCRPYGAAGIIRRPGRLHISWQGEDTLRVDFSAGDQTRLLRFSDAPPPPIESSWQGQSTAQWVKVRNWEQFAPPTVAPIGGTLKVITSHLRPGYLQSNGFPYSADTRMTEYFDRVTYAGQPWLIVTTVIEDKLNLFDTLYWTSNFKREPDGSKWKPKPCGA
jgi:hypothetical protein